MRQYGVIFLMKTTSKKDLPEQAKKLKALREEAGKSQAEMGQAIGVSQQQIQRYESGERDIPLDKAISLGQILGTNPNVFLKISTSLDFGGIGSHSSEFDLETLKEALVWAFDNEGRLAKLPKLEKKKRLTYAIKVCMTKGITNKNAIFDKLEEVMDVPV